ESDEDGALYAFRSSDYLSLDKHPDPFSVDQVTKIVPAHVTRRITAQAGVFTIHPKPREEFVDDRIQKLIIPTACRRRLKKTLSTLGINRASMFPDLDGIARHVAWLRTDAL